LSDDGIRAYDLPERVASYDADMEVMHPNRSKMIQVMLGFLSESVEDEFTVLELGAGTGYFTAHLLGAFPGAHVIGIDGAARMVEIARARLGPLADRVEFVVADFRRTASLTIEPGTVRAAVSSYALHHLSAEEKTSVLREVSGILEPGGWFLNADLVAAESTEDEALIQRLRVRGIVERAAPGDARFADEQTTRRFLDDLEAREGDQPLTVDADLAILQSAGLTDASVLWLEHREAVVAARRPLIPGSLP